MYAVRVDAHFCAFFSFAKRSAHAQPTTCDSENTESQQRRMMPPHSKHFKSRGPASEWLHAAFSARDDSLGLAICLRLLCSDGFPIQQNPHFEGDDDKRLVMHTGTVLLQELDDVPSAGEQHQPLPCQYYSGSTTTTTPVGTRQVDVPWVNQPPFLLT